MRLFQTYKTGDKGTEVKFLQRSLPWWCWATPKSSEADGDYGSKTAAAVRIFQGSVGLTQDGVAGEATLRALGVWSDVTPGIDISSYQTVTWADVDPSEIRFVLAKASEGATWQDPKFIDHIHGARGIGLQVGAYHFAKLAHEPWAEADNFLTQVTSAGAMDLPCILDFEEDAAQTSDPLQWILAWLRQVEAETGTTPMLYSGAWRLRAMDGPTSELTKYPYWIPAWDDQPVNYGPYPNWDCWQWTNKGQVAGVQGNVDRDWLVI